VLAVACLAQLMVVLDVSIVNVALPSIRASLHYSPTGLQWVVNAYVLTFAGFLMLGGRAGDLIGRRRIFLGGLALFTLASLAGGLAQDAVWLTAARAVQGLGGAVLSPATLSIVMTTFTEGDARNRAIGMWSAVAGAGGAVGVILGGILTSGLSWRWVLFVNVPIGVAGLVAGRRFLPDAPGNREAKLDIPGAITVTGGLALLVYAIVGTDTHPWASGQTVGTLAAAAALLAAFAVIQVRSAAPLVPFGLFRSRAVSGANLTMLAVGGAFFSFWYFLSLYVQGALGYDALTAGFAFFPMGVAIVIGAQASSRLVGRVGFRPMIVVGLAVSAAGLLWMSTVTDHSTYAAHILGAGVLVSLGFGLMFTPLAGSATTGVPGHQAGLASGLLNTSRQIGGSVGLAVLATIATSRIAALSDGRPQAPGAAALTSGYARVFLISAFFMIAAGAATLLLPSRRPAPAATARRVDEGPAALAAD
jgi:EmrB/QacA subfamily drug resistance transporter